MVRYYLWKRKKVSVSVFKYIHSLWEITLRDQEMQFHSFRNHQENRKKGRILFLTTNFYTFYILCHVYVLTIVKIGKNVFGC